MWLWILGILLSIVLFIYGLFKYYTGNKDYWPKNNVFFLDFDKIISFWDRMLFKFPFHIIEKQMYDAIKKEHVKFAGVMELRSPALVIMDLDLIKNITVKDFDHFINRRTTNTSGSDPLFHDMLTNKEDEEWKSLRTTMSPTFTTGKIKQMFQIFNESGKKLITFLDKETIECNQLDGIDVRDCMKRYTMDVIASSAFGIDSQIFNNKNSSFPIMAARLQNAFSGIKIIKAFLFIFFPKLLNFLKISISDREALNFFADIIQETIKQRETSNEQKRNDFIQLMIDTKRNELKNDEYEQLEEDQQLITTKSKKVTLTNHIILSQAILFFFAGFDTVETLLILALYELGLNQDIQEKLFDEIDQVMINNDGDLDYENINHMEYLDKVISETLRKYPPAIRTERKCTQDYKLPESNYIVKKGTMVMIPMYGIQHDEEYFPNPEKFDPERFSPEVKSSRHPYAYIPFGAGPRNCIAMRFALIEGKVALANLIHKYKIEPSQKTCIPLKCGKLAAYKPDDGMWLKLTRRT